MITGITDFDSLLSVCDKVKLDYVELMQVFNELNDQILGEKSCCKSSDLSFLYDKYCNQLNELIFGYKSEQEEITRSMHLYLDKVREDIK